MTECDLAKIDVAYERYDKEVRAGNYDSAGEELLATLVSIGGCGEIALERLRTTKVFVEGYLYIFLMLVDDDRFIGEFSKYFNHPNSDIIAATFKALAQRAQASDQVLEQACSVMLWSQRSELCNISAIVTFQKLNLSVPSFLASLGPNSSQLRSELKASGLPIVQNKRFTW